MIEFNMNYQEAIAHVLSGGFVVGEKFNENEFLYKNLYGHVCVGDNRLTLNDTKEEHLITDILIVSQKFKTIAKKSSRDIGHYFVSSLSRQRTFDTNSPWFVAYWTGARWFLPTWEEDEGESDEYWDEIDENKIKKS